MHERTNIEEELDRWARLLEEQSPALVAPTPRPKRTALLAFSVAAVVGVALLIPFVASRIRTDRESFETATAVTPSTEAGSDHETQTTVAPTTDVVLSETADDLFLSSDTVSANTSTLLYGVPMADVAGTTVRVEAPDGDRWRTVSLEIGPDLFIPEGSVTILTIPPLELGSYRITLGDSVSALVTVCDCATDPVMTEVLAVQATPAIVDGATGGLAFAASDLPLIDARATSISVWSDGRWVSVDGLPSEGLATEEILPFLRQAGPGTFRLAIESPSLLVSDAAAVVFVL